MKFNSMLLVPLSAMPLYALGSTLKLEGTYHTSCQWDGLPAVAHKNFLTFSENNLTPHRRCYTDFLCMNETQECPIRDDGGMVQFTIGEAIAGVSYPTGPAYRITLGAGEEKFLMCFYLDPNGLEGKEVLYLGEISDGATCAFNDETRVLIK